MQNHLLQKYSMQTMHDCEMIFLLTSHARNASEAKLNMHGLLKITKNTMLRLKRFIHGRRHAKPEEAPLSHRSQPGYSLMDVGLVFHLGSDHLPGLVDAAQTLLGGLQQLRRQLLQTLGVADLQIRPEIQPTWSCVRAVATDAPRLLQFSNDKIDAF